MFSQSLIHDEDFNTMSESAQNIFFRMLLVSDDCGIVPATDFTLKTMLAKDIKHIPEIEKAGLIAKFEFDGRPFYAFKRESFEYHQSYLIKNRTKSEYLKINIDNYLELYETLREKFVNYKSFLPSSFVSHKEIKDKRKEIKEYLLFADSEFFEKENFKKEVPDWSPEMVDYYHQAVLDWSNGVTSKNGKKQKRENWMLTVKSWERKDKRESTGFYFCGHKSKSETKAERDDKMQRDYLRDKGLIK